MNLKRRLLILCGFFSVSSFLFPDALPGGNLLPAVDPGMARPGHVTRRRTFMYGSIRDGSSWRTASDSGYLSHGPGYLMALYDGSASKANIQITGPDGITYKYFITTPGEYVTLRSSSGAGTYYDCRI